MRHFWGTMTRQGQSGQPKARPPRASRKPDTGHHPADRPYAAPRIKEARHRSPPGRQTVCRQADWSARGRQRGLDVVIETMRQTGNDDDSATSGRDSPEGSAPASSTDTAPRGSRRDRPR